MTGNIREKKLMETSPRRSGSLALQLSSRVRPSYLSSKVSIIFINTKEGHSSRVTRHIHHHHCATLINGDHLMHCRQGGKFIEGCYHLIQNQKCGTFLLARCKVPVSWMSVNGQLLATLVALHLTPVSERVSHSFGLA